MPAACCNLIEIEARGSVTVLHVIGADRFGSHPSDSSGRDRVGVDDVARFSDSGSLQILVNFRNIKTLRGPELTPYMKLAMRVRQRKGRIAVCHIPDGMRELLEVARLDRVIAVYHDEEQAIRELLLPAPVCA